MVQLRHVLWAGKPGVWLITVVAVLVAQSCLTLCNTLDHNPPGSSVHGTLQARTLEWVAIAVSRRSSRPRDRTWISCIAGGFFTVWATGKIKTLKWGEACSVMSNSLWPRGLTSPWTSPGQNTMGGSCSLSRGSSQHRDQNLCLPHCRRILYQLSHQGSPDFLFLIFNKCL